MQQTLSTRKQQNFVGILCDEYISVLKLNAHQTKYKLL
jgi:hypothetical protein